jgi:competence protein ComEC
LPYDESNRQNQLIQVGKFSILILEQRITDLPEKVDFVLWRKNNYTDIDAVLSQYTEAIIVLDGSNSDKTIDRLRAAAASNSDRLYLLKNNFAYVWEEE